MLVVLNEKLGHRLSPDSIATAAFDVEKTVEGLQAIRWFKEGRLLEIAGLAANYHAPEDMAGKESPPSP
jgi:hypothetical protein